MSEPAEVHYQRPGWFTKHVFNSTVAALTRLGVSVAGSRILEVRGRKTGEWRRTPVNPLSLAGQRYLVAARGETQWVRNLRVSRAARITLGLGNRRWAPAAGRETIERVLRGAGDPLDQCRNLCHARHGASRAVL